MNESIENTTSIKNNDDPLKESKATADKIYEFINLKPRECHEKKDTTNESSKESINKNDSEETDSTSDDLDTDKCDQKDQIIAVIGSWGTGKTTIKDSLVAKIKESSYKPIIVEYDALQFEDKEQVTSELYNSIAKKFGWWSRNRIKLHAVAQLKKESIARTLSMAHIWSAVIFAFFLYLLTKISKLSEINTFFANCFGYIGIAVQDPVLGNKLILGALLLIVAFLLRDYLLICLAGILPRKSHVDILKSIDCGDRQLILLIDEIDRLSPEATKLLFDEVLILKEALNKSKNKNVFKILMFYDEAVILHNYRQLNTYEPHIFLQKFYDRQYPLQPYLFINEFKIWVIDNINKPFDYSFTFTPTLDLVQAIALQISSFRQWERFEKWLGQKKNDFVKRFNIKSGTSVTSFDSDIFLFCLSLKFFFDLNQIIYDDKQVYSSYLDKCVKIFLEDYQLKEADLKSKLIEELEFINTGIPRGVLSQNKTLNKVLLPLSSRKFSENINKYFEIINWEYIAIPTQLTYNMDEWIKNNFLDIDRNEVGEKLKLFAQRVLEISDSLQCKNDRIDADGRYGYFSNWNYTIKHIKKQYEQRINCIHVFISRYLRIHSRDDNPVNYEQIENIFFQIKNPKKLDCLMLISTLLPETGPFDELTRSPMNLDIPIKDGSIQYYMQSISTITGVADLIIKEVFYTIDHEKIEEWFDNNSFYSYPALNLLANLNPQLKTAISEKLTEDGGQLFKTKNIVMWSMLFETNPLNLPIQKFAQELFRKDDYEYSPEIRTLIDKTIEKGIPTDLVYSVY